MTTDPEPTNVTNRSGGNDLTAQGDINITGDVVGRDKHTTFDQRGQQVSSQINVAGNYIGATAPPLPALHQLPPPPRDFTGRKAELVELLSKAETDGVTISGLQGMGGVGKTALALMLAERLKARYPDAQFYLDLKGADKQPLSVTAALTHVIRAYHPTAKLPDSEAELRGLYLSVLDGQRALLLMDNAADKTQVEPLIPPSCCFLLVTSRQHFAMPGLSAKDLNTLPPHEARELLLTIAPRIGGQADALAKLCGYLPLALRLAGSALAERRALTPTDYLQRLEDTQTLLDLIEASLSLSYNLLSEELQRAWCALAVFPDTFDLAAAAAVWNVAEKLVQDQFDELERFSLVDWNETVARARLHDLARLYAHGKLNEIDHADVRLRLAAHYRDVLSAADKLYLQGGDDLARGLALFDLEWPNIQVGQAWATELAATTDDTAQLCVSYAGDGVHCLRLRLHPREQIRWFEASLASARYLGDRQVEGSNLGNLGNAYEALGETRRAIDYYEQSLTIAREVGDRRSEGKRLGNLGIAYADLGETQRAIEYHEQALAIDREIGNQRSEGYHLGNLGNAYADLGETWRAIDCYEQALTLAREIGDRFGEGCHLGNLGIVYADLGETQRAIEYYEQALTLAREIGDRRREGIHLGNLGIVYAGLGEMQRAIEYYEQALTLAREIGDRRREGSDLATLGLAYADLGETLRAIEYMEAAHTIFKETESPSAEAAYKQLAEWRVKSGVTSKREARPTKTGKTRKSVAPYRKAKSAKIGKARKQTTPERKTKPVTTGKTRKRTAS
jgi:tetratricopeptide (TPR) repeat protein